MAEKSNKLKIGETAKEKNMVVTKENLKIRKEDSQEEYEPLYEEKKVASSNWRKAEFPVDETAHRLKEKAANKR